MPHSKSFIALAAIVYMGAAPEQRRFRTVGRDALAAAAGGGPDGATGRSYLLAIGVGGVPTQIELQGGYEDVYVKTPDGWLFASRIHVFPNIGESVQFGSGGQ